MTTNFRKKSDAFDDAFSQLQKSVCFVKSESSPQRRNHDHATCGMVAGTLTALLTHRSYTALAQSQNPSPSLGSCRMTGSCNVSCVSNRDCTPPRDARSCETSIAGLFKRLDPVCEAAKAPLRIKFMTARELLASPARPLSVPSAKLANSFVFRSRRCAVMIARKRRHQI